MLPKLWRLFHGPIDCDVHVYDASRVCGLTELCLNYDVTTPVTPHLTADEPCLCHLIIINMILYYYFMLFILDQLSLLLHFLLISISLAKF